ncbi:MAG: hypothetical protein HN757_17055 [Calditrichaeota bacterium]|jgi:hypothetical protein|nr:hypothetical protein [Calditrichota bacterium]
MPSDDKVKTCRLPGCYVEFTNETGKQFYCCRQHQNRAVYLKNQERLARKRAISADIDKKDKILEKLYTMYGSNPIPMWRGEEDELADINYCLRVQHPVLNITVSLFLDYAIYFDVQNKTVIIYSKDDLQEN